MPQARLGGGTARGEQHHITGPAKFLSRELLQQFVCSYTQMSYGHTKGGTAGKDCHESCSVRSSYQDRLTLLKVKAHTNAQFMERAISEMSMHCVWIQGYTFICKETLPLSDVWKFGNSNCTI